VLEYEPTSPGAEAVRDRAAQATPGTVTAAGTSTDRFGDPLLAGVIGAGSFAQRILIPALADAGFRLASVASATGLSAQSAAKRFAFGSATTATGIIDDPQIGLVVIATRHSSHAQLASAALRAGKAVFVEKPPCLSSVELREVQAASWESGRPLAVGFNRRHAPLARALRDHVAKSGPLNLIYRIKPDPLPNDHWLLDADEGGPLLGEGCHFVDLACWMIGSLPDRVSCVMAAGAHVPVAASQRFTVTLEFADGSIATINYGSAGALAVGKEYLEVHAGDRSGLLEDFRQLTLYSGRRREVKRARRQDKGHVAQMAHLRSILEHSGERGDDADPLDSMLVTIAALVSAQTGRTVNPRESAT
jgi:predicted dehydrogenase